MITLGTSVETFASVIELGGKMGPKVQRKTLGTDSSSVHEAMVTSSHPQELGTFEKVVFGTKICTTEGALPGLCYNQGFLPWARDMKA